MFTTKPLLLRRFKINLPSEFGHFVQYKKHIVTNTSNPYTIFTRVGFYYVFCKFQFFLILFINFNWRNDAT